MGDYEPTGRKISTFEGDLRRYEHATDDIRAAFEAAAPKVWTLSIVPSDESTAHPGHDTLKLKARGPGGNISAVRKTVLRSDDGEWSSAKDVAAEGVAWVESLFSLPALDDDTPAED